MVSAFTDRFDDAQFGQAIKNPCVAVSIADLTLSGEQTVNGVACTEGNRVLVAAQTDDTENGIWVCETSAWNRAPDFDGNRDVLDGTLVTVQKTTGMNFFYQVDATNPIVIGTSSIAFLAANDPNVSWPIIQAEIDGGYTADDIADSYEPYHVARYGVAGDGTTDDQAAIQAIITANLRKIVFNPYDTYLVGSKLTFPSTWSGYFGAESAGGFTGKTRLKWGGAAGTLIQMHSSGVNFENLTLDGNNQDVKLFQVKETSAGDMTAFKQSTMKKCTLVNTQSNAIHLGDFTTSALDADIAESRFEDIGIHNAKYSVFVDSTNAAAITFVNADFTRLSSYTQKPDGHVRMKRGGDLVFFGGFMSGFEATGNEYALYVKDGWLNMNGVSFEYGITSNHGGLLHLDTPTLFNSRAMPTSIVNCRDFSNGTLADNDVIKISSALHSLQIIGSSFIGRSGTDPEPLIKTTTGAVITSINNLYAGADPGLDDYAAISIGDRTYDGTTVYTIPTNFSNRVAITFSNTPYDLWRRPYRHISADTTDGAITIILPSVTDNRYGNAGTQVTITKPVAANAVSLTPDSGSEYIDGAGSVVLTGRYSSVTVESDGIDNWQVVSFTAGEAFSGASSGVGSVKMSNTNSANNAGWVEVGPGVFVPYWTDTTPA